MGKFKIKRSRWVPLSLVPNPPLTEDSVAEAMRIYQCSREDAVYILRSEDIHSEYWSNEIYQVLRRKFRNGMVQLNIRRRDGAADIRDWRHFQKIKNQLLGEECEAVELYPAESRLVDTSNKWHLWGFEDPKFRFPFGWQQRDVNMESADDVPAGYRQRKRED
jgi:hypothetical protein